jgi:hypothetical protein
MLVIGSQQLARAYFSNRLAAPECGERHFIIVSAVAERLSNS